MQVAKNQGLIIDDKKGRNNGESLAKRSYHAAGATIAEEEQAVDSTRIESWEFVYYLGNVNLKYVEEPKARPGAPNPV